MNFKLVSRSNPNPEATTQGPEREYQVLDPNVMLQYCEANGHDTSTWLGKANSFTDLRGPDPSYGHFLVDYETATAAMQFTVGRVDAEPMDDDNPIFFIKKSCKFDLVIVLDEVDNNNELVERVYKDLYVDKLTAITSTVEAEQGFYMLSLKDARFVLADEKYVNGTTQGASSTSVEEEVLEQYAKYGYNIVESWVYKEELIKLLQFTDPQKSFYVDDYGRFLYDLSSVDRTLIWGNEDSNYEFFGGNSVLDGSPKIPKPLTWEELFTALIAQFTSGIYEIRSGFGIPTPQNTSFPGFESPTTHRFDINFDDVEFPPWTPQDIRTAGVTVADILRRLCTLLSMDIIFEGSGKFRLVDVSENIIEKLDENIGSHFHTYMKQWTEDGNETINQVQARYEDMRLTAAKEGIPSQLVYAIRKLHIDGYAVFRQAVISSVPGAGTLKPVNFSSVYTTSPSYSIPIAFPIVWHPARGGPSVGSTFSVGAIPPGYFGGSPYTPSAGMPPHETFAEIFSTDNYRKIAYGFESRWSQYPSEHYDLGGFRDVSINDAVHRITWYYLGENTAGTYVENIGTFTKEELKAIAPMSNPPDGQYISLVSGTVTGTTQDPEEEIWRFSINKIIPILGVPYDLDPEEGEEDSISGIHNTIKVPLHVGDKVVIARGVIPEWLHAFIDPEIITDPLAFYDTYFLISGIDVYKKLRHVQGYPLDIDDPSDSPSPTEEFALVANNNNEGMVWTEVEGGGGGGGGTIDPNDPEDSGAVGDIVENLIEGGTPPEFPDVPPIPGGNSLVDAINKLVSGLGGGSGTAPKIFSAVCTATGHGPMVSYGQGSSIFGVLPGGDVTGQAENIFDLPWMETEPMVIIKGTRTVAIKGSTTVIRAKITTVGGVGFDGTIFAWALPEVIVGHLDPGLLSGEAVNTLKHDLEEGQWVTLAQDGIQWRVVHSQPFECVVRGNSTSTVNRNDDQFSLGITELVSGLPLDGITSITVTTEPKITTDNTSSIIYAIYDRTAGNNITDRWTTRDTGNEEWILKGKEDYQEDEEQVFVNDNGELKWVTSAFIQVIINE